MDSLVALGNEVWTWFGVEDNQNRANAIAAVLAVLLTILGLLGGAFWFIVKPIFKKKPPEPPVFTASLPTGDVLSMDQHLMILDKREAQLQEKLRTPMWKKAIFSIARLRR